MKVSDLIVEELKSHGVTEVFGIPGDAVNHLVDSIHRDEQLEFIQVQHEEAAAFAASAQAKLTGKVGVCVGTAGPGAIHLLNGLYDAKKDAAPVLVITGEVPRTEAGTNYHQEVATSRLFEPVSTFSHVIADSSQVGRVVHEGIKNALSKRGVAHVGLPSDIAEDSTRKDSPCNEEFDVLSPVAPCVSAVDKLADMIQDSESPVLLIGEGARNCPSQIIELSRSIGAPIIKSLRGKDIIPDDEPSCFGVLGLLGTKPAQDSVESCDLLVMIGTDFPYREYYPTGSTKIVQVDDKYENIGRRTAVDLSVHGDAEQVLKLLTTRIKGLVEPKDFILLQDKKESWLTKMSSEQKAESENGVNPKQLAHLIGEKSSENAVFCVDTGTVTGWAARHINLRKNQRMIYSSSLASMAFSLPAAIGASIRFPEKEVICLTGDGAFAMLMAELATVAKYSLPIKVIVFNNQELALVKMEQQADGLAKSNIDLPPINYQLFAQSVGVDAVSVSSNGELESAIEAILNRKGPALLDARVDSEALLVPPKVSSRQALNYVKAKIKEAVA